MRLLSLCGIAMLFALAGWSATVVVDPGVRYQTIEGFGTCTIDWMQGSIGKIYETPKFQAMYAQDLGCSIMRMEIDPDLQPTADLDLDHLNVEKLNFNAYPPTMNGKLAADLQKVKLDEMKIIGSVWSPPGWMKDTNGTINGGHLRADRREHFGKYLAAFCVGFERKFGVPVYAISIQNELAFVEPYNSCVYDPEQFRDTVKAVAAQFRKWGVKTKIMGPEDVGASAPHEVGRQMGFISATEADPQAARGLDFYNVHGYAGDGIAAGGTRDSWSELRNRTQGFGKSMWMTETSGEAVAWPGALQVAASCHQALSYGNCSAWVYWQIIDPNPSQFALTAGTDTTAKKYNAAKHFFRYVRPGAVRVGASGETLSFTTDAFIHDTNQTLTLVLANFSDRDEPVQMTLAGKPGVTSFDMWRTSATENFAQLDPLPVKDDAVTFTLPAKSIVTLQGAGKNLTPTAPTPPTNLLAAATSGKVQLSWTAGWGAVDYVIKRSSKADVAPQVIARRVTGSRYVDTRVVDGETYYYTVCADNGVRQSKDSNKVAVTLVVAKTAYTAIPPALDGELDAVWEQAVAQRILHISNGSSDSEADLSASFKALWDQQNLYLLLDVKDNVHLENAANIFVGDSVEFFIDGDNSKDGNYGLNDFQYCLPAFDGTGLETRHQAMQGVKKAVKLTPQGYRMEIAFPLATLQITPFGGSVYGLDIQVNDSDVAGQFHGKRAWWGTQNNAWLTPTAFGAGKLLAAPNAGPTPGPPVGLQAVAGNAQVALNWQAAPAATGYLMKRADLPGGPYTTVAIVTGTQFTELGVPNDMPLYYTVCGYNLAGQGQLAAEITTTPVTPPLPAGSVGINCGGPAIGDFQADTGFTGGSAAGNYAGPIDRRFPNPGPEKVYHSERTGGTFSYTIANLQADANYTVRLHFREDYWNVRGDNAFNVRINGKPALINYDILAKTGVKYKAVVEAIETTADAKGAILIEFTAVKNGAKVSAIEVVKK